MQPHMNLIHWLFSAFRSHFHCTCAVLDDVMRKGKRLKTEAMEIKSLNRSSGTKQSL